MLRGKMVARCPRTLTPTVPDSRLYHPSSTLPQDVPVCFPFLFSTGSVAGALTLADPE